MNDNQQHLYAFLLRAADALRAFQMFEIGQAHGEVPSEVNNDVLAALTSVWTAARKMEG